MTWTYFTDDEVKGLDNELVAMLDMARHKAGIPFIITDGLRTGAGNPDRNAVNNSAHLAGKAVDLRCRDSQSLSKMMDALADVGFRRKGIYFTVENGKARPTHIHVDVDATKDQNVTWLAQEL